MQLLYYISVKLYHLGILLASLFNKKAKLWIQGRRNQQSTINNQQSTIWFHCASLGEFEQGRELIEKFKIQPFDSAQGDKKPKIVLTFFSPSGYEMRKNYEHADVVAYLPMDSPSAAKKFIDQVNPSHVFFIKYEFWFYYLRELKKRNIPTYLVSGIFRPDQYFFKWYGGWALKQLSAFKHFFLQDKSSEQLLHQHGYTNTSITGDTRFDRVLKIISSAKELPVAAAFANNRQVLVAGSTWEEDEQLLASQAGKLKMIIAPHDVSENRLQSLEKRFSNTIRFSKADTSSAAAADVLLIDNIGMLSSLYGYGQMAYVGGGFGKGIHNILEAAAYGMPVIFGPNYRKFAEAEQLIKKGGAFSISTATELEQTFSLLNKDPMILKMASEISKNYVRSGAGATDAIYKKVFGE